MGETHHTGDRPLDLSKVPDQFGRYRIEQELGRGGMGAVFLAHDGQLDRKVAIKIPLFSEKNTAIAIERFRREARAMATLQHANLCPIYDVGQFERWHFLIMAYIDGQTLTRKLKEDGLTVFQSMSLITKIALALQKAHDTGIVHRDLKPSNIMLRDELEPVVMDFGLARRESVSEVEITHANTLLGSPAFMAPEQVEARHDDVGPHTDVYAMGVILYRMLTGRLPFTGSSAAVFGQIVSSDPVPPSQVRAGLPPAIDALCMKAMAKSPADRYGSALEFSLALTRYMEESRDVSPTLDGTQPETSGTSNPPNFDDNDESDNSSLRRSRDAEKRQLTVMICNCDATDPEESLASLDPEDQRDILTSFQQLCEEVTNRFGGTVVQSTGQELLLCFGYPTAYEDAAHRAVRAGLVIQEEIKRLNEIFEEEKKPPLSAWTAIHTGMVVAGEQSVSESQVDTLSIIGEARTVTGRLESFAEPEQVIVSDTTHRLVRDFFVCESQGTQKIRGIPKPVEIFRVMKESTTRNRVELIDSADLTPLVGRDMELGIIKDRWEHAVEGAGQVVLLIGDAGLGKSRLMREIKQHVTGEDFDEPVHVIEWRCSPYHEGSRLFPAIDFFERLLEFSREESDLERLGKLARHLNEVKLDDPESMAIFASLLSISPDERCASLDLSPARQKEKTQELLLEWLHEYASQRAVLFIVEDLHWVDPTTLELLTGHVDQGLHESVLTLMSFRPEFRTPWQSYSHMTQVALTKLTKRQIGEMIRHKTGFDDIPQQIVARLAERTDGVPLFVEEFTQMVMESGALDAGSADNDVAAAINAIPVTLHDLLAARLDRLESDPGVAQLGAAIGREFEYELIRSACTLDEDKLQAELGKLVEAELLFQKGRPPKSTYIFKHALIQDAAYNSLLKQKRQQFHLKIAETLERNFEQTSVAQPELLGHHFSEAGELEKGIQYWLMAGQRAQQRSANHEAISHLTRGLSLLQTLAETPERDQSELAFQLTLAPVLMAARGWSAPEVGTAIERAQQLVSQYGTVEDQFFVMWGLWGWRIIRADMDICTGIAAQITQLVDQAPENISLLPEACWVAGCTAYYKGDFSTSLPLLEQGFELSDGDKVLEYALKTGQCCNVMCLSHSALALWQLGFVDQATRRADETVQLGKQLNHPFSYAMSLFFSRQVLEFCGRHDEASKRIDEEYAVCHDNGFVFFEVHAIFGRGVNLLRRGKIDDARIQFEQGLKMLHATGGNLSMDHPYRNIAEAFLMADLHDDAVKWLQLGFDLVNNHNERGMESEFLRLQADLELKIGNEQGAEKLYGQALEVARKQKARSWELRTMTRFATLRHQQGKTSEAHQMLAATYGSFTEGLDTFDLCLAKSLLAKLS